MGSKRRKITVRLTRCNKMKCYSCKGILNFKVPESLEGKIIKCIDWTCPFCKTENKDYFP
jgi:hypothetical protein